MKPGWTHHEPVEIRFGTGCLEELPGHVGDLKDPLLLVTTPGMTRRGVTHRVEGLLEEHEVILHDQVDPNPTLRAVEQARERYQDQGVQTILGIGGGSVLDTAKALSLMLVEANRDVTLEDHFYADRAFPETRPLPFVAVPTTAGTGSEVTPFGTLWDDENKKKQSITTEHLHPRTALLDPELTLDLPKSVTLPSALDALSHALESVWNHNATPITRLYAAHAARGILSHLVRVLEDPQSVEDRTVLLESSLLAGLAIATTRTALAHSISYPLTAHHDLTHGYACSFTLPALLRFNNETDDGRLQELAERVGFDDPDGLARAIETIYIGTGAAEAVEKTLGNKDVLIAHLDEMFNPQRAGNNMRKPEQKHVKDILEASGTIVGL